MVYVWLAALVVFIVIEAATYALVSVWFAAGALGGLVTAALGGELWLQIAVFVVVSAVVLIALRPLVKKLRRVKKTPTNADAVIGSVAVVTEAIDNELGRGEVFVQGKKWSARSESGAVIPAEARVKPVRIEGVKLFVEEIKCGAEAGKE